MDQYKQLAVHSLEKVDSFFTAVDAPEKCTDSPAMNVVTDFHFTRPSVLEADVCIDEAIRMMVKAHVHMKLIVDSNERFLGIVSMSMLQGRRAMRAAQQTGATRAEITVADVMVRRDRLHALSHEELQKSTVGDVLHTLKDLGEHHMLVLDRQQNRICGVVAASDVAKFLNAPIEIVQRAASFVEVVDALA